MKKYELLKWIFANAIGLGIGFLVYLQVSMVFEHGFDTEMYWKWVPPEQNFTVYFGILISALVGGAILGWAQSRIIKTKNIKSNSWILATTIGFGLVVLINWPLLYTGDLGNIPGPVEPLIFTVGGCIFAGAMQFFLLRRLGYNAKKWFLMLVVGLIVSVLLTGLFFTFVGDPLSISWPLEVFFSGFIIAGVTALISGKALFSVFSKKS